jgi:toxin ParE1/3/4
VPGKPVRHFPLVAPARDHFAPSLRAKFHGAYAMYYRPLADQIVIVGVLHGARDTAAIAKHGGFTE